MDIPYGGRQHVLVFVDSFSGSHALRIFLYQKPRRKWAAVVACLSASTAAIAEYVFCSVCLLIVKPAMLKDCPDKMVVTFTQCLFSTVQAFVVAVVAERDFSKWKLRFDISLLAILYSVSSAFFFFRQGT